VEKVGIGDGERGYEVGRKLGETGHGRTSFGGVETYD
jgi:hypothetical protein